MIVVGVNGSGNIVGRSGRGRSSNYRCGTLHNCGFNGRCLGGRSRCMNNYWGWSWRGSRGCRSWRWRSRVRGELGGLGRVDHDGAVNDNRLDLSRRSWDGTFGDGDIDDVGDDVSHDLSVMESLVDRGGDGQSSAQGSKNN